MTAAPTPGGIAEAYPGERPAKTDAEINAGNTATALVADLDAKAAKRIKAKPIKPTKPAKTAKPKPAPKVRGKRDGVCNKVIEAIHARWTSIDELLKLSGWQRHTLRGYISTRAAKDKFTVEKRKVDGVPQYRVERAA